MNTRLAAAPLAALLLVSACGGITIQTDGGKNTPQQTAVERSSPSATTPQSTPTDFATPSPATVTVTAPATSNPDPADGNGDLPAKTCPNNSLEGCFTYDEMHPYINAVLPTIEQFLESRYKAMPLPDHIWFVEAGTSGETACTATDGSPAPYTSLSFLDCPADKSIYTGQDSRGPTTAPWATRPPRWPSPHEYGHHIQVMVDVPRPATREERINHENRGRLHRRGLRRYADEQGWLTGRHLRHRRTARRHRRQRRGPEPRARRSQGAHRRLHCRFRNGLTACNAYHVDVPIIE